MTFDGSVLSEALLAVGSGEPPTAEQPAATAAAVGETEPEKSVPAEGQQQQQTQQINWDDPANPYVQRFKGLQGTVQREVERRKQLERELNELREQALRAQVAHLAPEQQERVIQQYRQTRQVQEREQALREHEARLEEAARVVVAWQIAQQHDGLVDMRELLDIPTPQLMEQWAKRLAEERRARQQQARQVEQRDRFEGNLLPPNPKPPEPPKSLAEAEDRFLEIIRERMTRR